MKKIFGELNLTWPKIVIFAIFIGIYTAVVAMIPQLRYTSFITITATFEVWVLFGILIIMNSKSNKESALKCFVFFLISQPIVYLLQDVINHTHLFQTYYKYWFIWTVLCLPMGYIGYYMKKDKWWGYLILLPMIILVSYSYYGYFSDFMFNFPKYILIVIFCAVTMIIYPLAIFNNKKIKITGLVISIGLIIALTALNIINPPVYNTQLFGSNGEHYFDDTYKAYLTDDKYGEIDIKYDERLEEYFIDAHFKREGKTSFVIEHPDGEKEEYDIIIKRNTYDIEKK